MTRKIISIALIFSIISGCTTLKPVELSADEMRDQIARGELVQVGDNVKVTLDDGSEYQFQVSQVNSSSVQGDGIEVQIDQIAQIETKEFSYLKTGALVGGTSIALGVLLLLGLSGAFVLGG